VREALPAGRDGSPGARNIAEALIVQRVAAQLALDAGDLPAARSWLDAQDRWLAWCEGGVRGRAEGALAWAAYHRAAGETARAREQAEAALAHASAPRQPLVLLAVRRLLGELETEVGHHDAALDHLDAALALADACAAPYERALTLLALAELRLAARDRDGARGALAEARGILKPLGARPALARAATLAAHLAPPASRPARPTALPFGLTEREAEGLRLVAQGLTNAQIAAHLYLSKRTVEQHLRAIFGKLGVGTRTAAARLARDHGLA
jgi:DNA-binding CsgD family transcriptional regulator